MSPTRFPFPFFGAGEASYFELIEVRVRFTRTPDAGERRRLSASLPKPLTARWDRATLTLTGAPHLGRHAIHRTYPADPGTRATPGRDGTVFAHRSQVRRFNHALEQWLLQSHAVVPIAVAVRPEDTEADRLPGVRVRTRFSAWHRDSVTELGAVLAALHFDPRVPVGEPSLTLVRDVLTLARASGATLTPAQRDFVDPRRAVEAAVKAGDVEAVRAALRRDQERTGPALARAAPRLLCELGDELLAGPLDADLAGALLAATFERDDRALRRRLLRRARGERELTLALEDSAGLLTAGRRFAQALATYEVLLELPTLTDEALAQALWVAQRDNTGLRVKPARARRFLARCLPRGADHPAIFFNGACVAMELGDRALALELIAQALEHGYEDPQALRDEAMFTPLRATPQFRALFD